MHTVSATTLKVTKARARQLEALIPNIRAANEGIDEAIQLINAHPSLAVMEASQGDVTDKKSAAGYIVFVSTDLAVAYRLFEEFSNVLTNPRIAVLGLTFVHAPVPSHKARADDVTPVFKLMFQITKRTRRAIWEKLIYAAHQFTNPKE